MRAAARLTLLATLMAVPVLLVSAGTLNGKIKGVLTIDGRAAPGIEVALVNVNSGVIKSAHSGDGGAFAVTLPPGDYVAAVLGQRRLSVSRAPSRVTVRAGAESALRLELIEQSTVAPVATAGSTLARIPTTGITQHQGGPGPWPCRSPNKHGTCGDGN